jgi:signal transduction histidine kinase
VGYNAYLSHLELKNKNRELDESARFRSQLLQSITHGINTPLSTIQGYTKLSEMKFSSFINKNAALKDYLNKLHDATENMVQKSGLFLDLARLNRNGLQLNEQDVPLVDFVKLVEEFVKEEAKARSINLSVREEFNENISFKIDLVRIKSALNTIFLNALRYAPLNDNITLRFDTIDTYIQIKFEDHGPQIKSNNIPLIGCEFLPESLSNERIHFDDSLSVSFAVKFIHHIKGDLHIASSKKKTVHTIKIPLKEKRVYEKTA